MRVVKISSLACTSCIIMDNIFNKIKNEYNFDYEEYDYDLDEKFVKSYDPGKILPIYIIIDQKEELGRIVGEKTEKKFREELEKIINEKV